MASLFSAVPFTVFLMTLAATGLVFFSLLSAALVTEAKAKIETIATVTKLLVCAAGKIVAKQLDPASQPAALLKLSAAPVWGALFIITEDRSISDDSVSPLFILTEDRSITDDSVPALPPFLADAVHIATDYVPAVDYDAEKKYDEDAVVGYDAAADHSPRAAPVPYANNLSRSLPRDTDNIWEADVSGTFLYDEVELTNRADRKHPRAALQRCTWAALDKPDVFYKCTGPTLMLTTPEGVVKYPQDMGSYPMEKSWADLDDDDDDW